MFVPSDETPLAGWEKEQIYRRARGRVSAGQGADICTRGKRGWLTCQVPSWYFVAERVLEYSKRSDLGVAFSTNFTLFLVPTSEFQLLTKIPRTLRKRSHTCTPQSAPSLNCLFHLAVEVWGLTEEAGLLLAVQQDYKLKQWHFWND